MKATIFCATSLDGFIAREDGDVSWLGDPPEGGDDGGFSALMESIDFVVMGRNTFDKVLTFGMWPYRKPVIVLTSRSLNVPENLSEKVEAMSGAADEIVAALERRGAQHLYIDGGDTVRRFLQAGWIQNLIITTVPILIGSGIPLFGKLENDIKLKHLGTRALGNGLVQNEYDVVS